MQQRVNINVYAVKYYQNLTSSSCRKLSTSTKTFDLSSLIRFHPKIILRKPLMENWKKYSPIVLGRIGLEKERIDRFENLFGSRCSLYFITPSMASLACIWNGLRPCRGGSQELYILLMINLDPVKQCHPMAACLIAVFLITCQLLRYFYVILIQFSLYFFFKLTKLE